MLRSSRRSFLGSTGSVLTGAWLASHWPAIAAAGRYASESAEPPAPAGLSFLTAADAADVEAIAAQVVPSGATPGAREARVVYFIDRALTTFYAGQAPAFRSGLADFRTQFRAARPAGRAFAGASAQEQLSFLRAVDTTPFFEQVRVLTILGMFVSPKYGGNYGSAGWKLLGFADEHVFEPPFGDYDRDYAGFVPYGERERS